MPKEKRKLHKPDYILAVITFVLVIFGFIMIFSASSVISYTNTGTPYYFLWRQAISLVIGIAVWIACYLIDYHFWKNLALPLLILTIILLIAIFIPGLRVCTESEVCRWVRIGPISLQPAEIAKLTFILYLAAWLEKRGEYVRDFIHGFLPFVIVLGIITFLIMSEPDLGTMSVIVMTGISMFFVAGASLPYLAVGGIFGCGILWFLIKTAPYRMERLMVFLDPSKDTQGIGYHINQALLAIGSGGILGLGFGQSRQKYNYLPHAEGDSIFAIIAEELGFIRTSLMIILFMILAWRGFKIARKAPDIFGRLVACGITSLLVFQALINISAMIGLLPLTGIPLPFISHGGTSLVISLAGIGILLNISRQTIR